MKVQGRPMQLDPQYQCGLITGIKGKDWHHKTSFINNTDNSVLLMKRVRQLLYQNYLRPSTIVKNYLKCYVQKVIKKKHKSDDPTISMNNKIYVVTAFIPRAY